MPCSFMVIALSGAASTRSSEVTPMILTSPACGQIDSFREAGGQGRDLARKQGRHGFAARVVGHVLDVQRVLAGRFHHHGRHEVVHAAGNRTAADGGACRDRRP